VTASIIIGAVPGRADRLVLLLAGAGPLHQADHHLRDLCLRPESSASPPPCWAGSCCAVLLTAGFYWLFRTHRGAYGTAGPRRFRDGIGATGTAPGASRAVTASTPTAKPANGQHAAAEQEAGPPSATSG